MRIFAIAVAMLALLAIPAHAQARRPAGEQSEQKKTGPAKPQVDDKAYKAALERIPDSKEKYDPWGIARPEPAKKSK